MPSQPAVTVLLVEDHIDTLQTMRRLLVGMGYRVIPCENASEALTLSAAEAFDVLVSDIGLPGVSGNDLMRRLRQRHPRLPGIALSGFSADEDARASADAGFNLHLTKPIDVHKLHEAIGRLMADLV
jgi:CheY-like chemotaxis protein